MTSSISSSTDQYDQELSIDELSNINAGALPAAAIVAGVGGAAGIQLAALIATPIILNTIAKEANKKNN